VPTFEEKITANVDALIDKSRHGEGLLTPYFARLRKGISDTATTNNDFRKQSGGAVLTDAQLNNEINKTLDETITNEIKPALFKTANGESADIDVKDVANLAGAVSNTASSLSSGSIFGLLTAIPALLTNSIVADFFKALIGFIGGGKPIGESMQQLKFERSATKMAAILKVDPASLSAALTAEPAVVAPAMPNVPREEVLVPGTGAQPASHDNKTPPPLSAPPKPPEATAQR
jgi:hypothetical protein